MPDQLRQDLKDEAERLSASQAAICREALTNHLKDKTDVDQSLPQTQAVEEPIEDEPESAEPWYIAFQDKILQDRTGPYQRNENWKRAGYQSPTPERPPVTSSQSDDDFTREWSR